MLAVGSEKWTFIFSTNLQYKTKIFFLHLIESVKTRNNSSMRIIHMVQFNCNRTRKKEFFSFPGKDRPSKHHYSLPGNTWAFHRTLFSIYQLRWPNQDIHQHRTKHIAPKCVHCRKKVKQSCTRPPRHIFRHTVIAKFKSTIKIIKLRKSVGIGK